MATLEERVSMSANGFQVVKDSTESTKKAYYNLFTLQDAEVEKNRKNPVTYWSPYETSTYTAKDGEFVCVWEIDEDGNIEEYNFCYSGGGAKPRISWGFESAPKYGTNAYMLTIEWTDNKFEKINRKHMWLYHRKSGRKFNFLKEILYPLEPGNRIKKDQYIITLPSDVAIDELIVGASDLLRQKYSLVH